MTTKDDERKALEQIKKIIDGLGSDSYIGTAIDAGVIRMAEENIDNDWACSPSDRIDALENGIQAARIDVQEAKEAAEKAEASAESWKKAAEDIRKEADAARAMVNSLSNKIISLEDNRREAERKYEDAAAEIIMLKAQLYDYMKDNK